jgi:BirA family transcriptional regulator, biotin operon repressor / biotin---[acetyl-CoA-carboxylase] ligase
MKEVLKISDIKENLHTNYVGRNIVYTENTSSTNDDAKKAAERGEDEGTVFISEVQTSGRGRMYREWKTAPVEAIAMTILIRPQIAPSQAPTITPVLALSIIEALRELTGLEVQIKWPNDIFLEGKKIGGILTEMNSGMDEVKYIVIGMGLNVNQVEMDLALINIATSLRIISGKTFNRELIISKVLDKFENNYDAFNKFGLTYFSNDLKAYSSILGKEVIAISGLEMIEGVAEDLDEAGNLLLRIEGDKLKTIIYGDVSIKCKEVLKG